MRFSDQLMHHLFREARVKPLIVVIDNVAKYFFETMDQDMFDWGRDFPNIAPPWPLALFSVRAPRYIRNRNSITRNPGTIPEWAILTQSYDLWDQESVQMARNYFDAIGYASDVAEVISEARWWTLAHLFLSPQFPESTATLIIFIDRNGCYMQPSPENRFMYLINSGLYVTPADQDMVRDGAHSFFEPMLLAASFLHCRNTVVQDVVPPSRLAERTLKRCGVPLNIHKVLEIKPMTDALAASAGPGIGLVKRLHICRGHFKDYRGRGLFGKVQGLFWWGQHVRGDRNVGAVTKDYSIYPPGSAGHDRHE